VPGDRPFLLVPPLSSFSAEGRSGQTVTGFLDPTHLINTFGLIGIMAILSAECGLLVGFFLPGDSPLFTAGLLVAGGLVAPLWLLLVLLPLAAVAGNLVG
jgi:membrane-associated protein